jgi:hypothetical protein
MKKFPGGTISVVLREISGERSKVGLCIRIKKAIAALTRRMEVSTASR